MRLLLALLALLWAVPAMADDDGLYTEPFLALDPGLHTAPISRLDADAAGRFLVTASLDKTVRVWAAGDGRLLRTIRLPAGPGNLGKAYAVAISPDGQTIAAGGWTTAGEEQVYLFERASGRLLGRVGGLPDVVFHLAFSPDGRQLAATLGGDKGVRLLDTKGLAVTAEDTDYGERSLWAAWSPDGTRLATTSYDGKLRLYDAGLRRLTLVEAPGGKELFALAFSPDGTRLAVGYVDSRVVDVLDAATLAPLPRPETEGIDNGNISSVAWSADGAFLLAAGRWQVGGQHPVRRWAEGGRGVYRDLKLSRDTLMDLRPLPGGRIAFAAQEPALGLLGPAGEVFWRRDPVKADLRDQENVLAVSADGAEVAFGYAQYGRDPARYALRERRLTQDGTGEGLATARTSSPGLEVTGWKNGTDPALNGRKLPLKDHETSRSLTIAPDGQRFALGADWTLRLFDRAGAQVWQRPAPSAVWAVTVSADGRLLVAGYGDGTIRWHRLSDGEELLAFYPDGDRERWVLWTPQGYYTASPGGEDLIGWQVNRGWDKAPEFYTASRFREQFHRPDVIDLVLQELDVGKAVAKGDELRGPARTVEVKSLPPGPAAGAPQLVTALLPPTVTITSPVDGSVVEGADTIVSFEAEAADPVRSMMALVNGRLALRQPRPDTMAGRVSGRLLVPLPAGEAIVSVIAENAQGASDPATVRLTARSGTPATAIPKATLHLIAAGVSTYRNSASLKLKYAAKDATDLASRLLREKGRLYADVKPIVMPEDEADRGSILRSFRDVLRAVRPGDVVVVFLSGHGAMEGGRYYFLPSDVEADSSDAIADTGISHLELRDAFRRFFEAKAKVIALIDTCYSGDVVEGKALPPDLDIVAQELYQAENGVIVLTSSTGKEVSKERDDLQNGIFTSALLEALNGEADRQGNRDGYISLAELRAFLPLRVAALSGNRQHPTARVPFEKDWEARIALVR